MTPGQFQMLSVALFCIGVYGLALRRDSRRMIISLGIMIGAVALSLIGSNLTMNTDNATGVYFAVTLILYGLVIMFLLAQSGKPTGSAEPREADLVRPDTIESESGANLKKKISRETLIALQIPLMLAIVVGDSLSRMSLIGFYAFLSGIAALSFLAIRANKARRDKSHRDNKVNEKELQNQNRMNEARVL